MRAARTARAASWPQTNQKRCGHQVQFDWPLFGGTLVLNLDNTVNWWAKAIWERWTLLCYGLLLWLRPGSHVQAASTRRAQTKDKVDSIFQDGGQGTHHFSLNCCSDSKKNVFNLRWICVHRVAANTCANRKRKDFFSIFWCGVTTFHLQDLPTLTSKSKIFNLHRSWRWKILGMNQRVKT